MTETKSINNYRQTLRERILETAMRAFATHGIRSVRMDDIAQSLGISKRTLYEIYENKELLLLEGVKKYHAWKNAETQRMEQDSKNVMEAMLRIYRERVEEFKTTCPQFYLDMQRYPSVLAYLEQQRGASQERFISFLRRGVGEGYFRADVQLELVTMMFNAITNYILDNELLRQYSLEQIFHDLVFVSLRGFCTPMGIELFDEYFK